MRGAVCALSLVVIAGCVPDPRLRDGGADASVDTAVRDSAVRDTARSDSGASDSGDADSCEPESCDGTDNDCDGLVDEDFDRAVDPEHCGACGVVCDVPNARNACVESECAIWVCLEGFEDCDGAVETGCETNTRISDDHCGRCGHACAGVACTDGFCPNEVITNITVGDRTVCARRLSGEVACWGRNDSGAIGDGTTEPRPLPTAVTDLSGVVDVSATVGSSCAALDTGRVRCWGANGLGQLGDGTLEPRLTPVEVLGITDAVAVSVGYRFACALHADGRVSCWGEGTQGQLGDGRMASSTSPVYVSGISDAVSVDSASRQSAARLSDGRVVGWGSNANRTLSDALGSISTPLDIPSFRDARRLAFGIFSLCIVTRSGGARCRGRRPWAADATDIVQVSATWEHACVLRSSGSVSCWGASAEGGLGLGDTLSASEPMTVPGIDDATDMETGIDSTCVVRSTGRVNCWGLNDTGQLGDGTMVNRFSPTEVVGLP